MPPKGPSAGVVSIPIAFSYEPLTGRFATAARMLQLDAMMSIEDYPAQLLSIIIATLRAGDRKINMQPRHHIEYYICDYKRGRPLTALLYGSRCNIVATAIACFGRARERHNIVE